MSTRRWSLALLLALVASTLAGVGRAQDAEVPGKIAFVMDGGLWVWEGGETSRVLKEDGVSDARWSPDGESLLFVRSGNSFSDLAVLNVDNPVPLSITDNQPAYEVGTEVYVAASAWALDPSWSASGLIGYVSEAPDGDRPFALWLKDGLDGAPYLAPLTEYEEAIESVTLSGDGSIAAYVVRQRLDVGSDINVWLRDLATGEPFLAAQSGGEVFDPALSPDGQSIAVAIRDPGGMTDVWMVDRETLDRSRVTSDAQALAPTWSSDGKWVAFMRLQDYQFEVWAAPVQDGNPGRPFKLFSADDIDSRSGLSWWLTPPEEL